MSDARAKPIKITPLAGAFTCSVSPPGSKSLTNRALLLAALAEGTSTLENVLFADDTRVMIKALGDLGFKLQVDEDNCKIRVQGGGGTIPAQKANLFLGNSGTTYRFLTAACCLGQGVYTLDGVDRMHKREIDQLVDKLRELGATIEYLGKEGYPPLRITSNGLTPDNYLLIMKPTKSSQYISALLQIAPYYRCHFGDLHMQFKGPITSRPYVEMTLSLMTIFGIALPANDLTLSDPRINVPQQAYKGTQYKIEMDASNASYFLAAAAITPGSVCTIEGLGKNSLQGDARFITVLQRMGVPVEQDEGSTTVTAQDKQLVAGDFDLNDMPDMAQTLAVVALFAKESTTIHNVGNLRIKETDRLAALETELTKLGATVTITGDDITIKPPKDNIITPAAIDTYDDHRMAMSFAVAGLRVPGIVINDPDCVNKTYPNFFSDLDKLHGAVINKSGGQS